MKEVLVYIEIMILTVLLPVFSANAQMKKIERPIQKRQVSENFALDTILKLPEIQEADSYIRRKTKGERHLFSMIYGRPDKQHPYYWVVVGEDNGMCFVTHFTFYVYTNGRKILYHDNFSERTMDLSTWQRKYHRRQGH